MRRKNINVTLSFHTHYSLLCKILKLTKNAHPYTGYSFRNHAFFCSSSLQEALSQVSQASGSQVRGQPSRTPSQVTVLSTSASLLVRNGSAQLEGCPDKASTVGVASLQDEFGRHHKTLPAVCHFIQSSVTPACFYLHAVFFTLTCCPTL